MSTWREIETAPRDGTPFESKRDGEVGTNVCHIIWHPEHCYEPEYVETATGRTTVTHNSFAPPTHWRPLPNPPEKTP